MCLVSGRTRRLKEREDRPEAGEVADGAKFENERIKRCDAQYRNNKEARVTICKAWRAGFFIRLGSIA